MIEDKKVISKLNEFYQRNVPAALVMVVEVDGSTPRGIGSMMLVDQKGNLLAGTIGGGTLEEKAKKDAVKCIKEKESKLIKYDLNINSKNKNTIPMICGGKTSIFVKVMHPGDNLVIAGGGHISHKLSKLAKTLGYTVTVLDYRKEMLTKDRFPEADKLILGDIPENLSKIPINPNTNIVIVTHGHRFDQECLETVIDTDAKYIGMIGSKNKVKTCLKNLEDKGISEDKLSKVYAPIGLNIGGETPEEIALSIMAEIQSVKYKKEEVCYMKDTKGR